MMTVKTRITIYIAGAGFMAGLLFSVVIFLEFVEQPFELLDAVLKDEAYRAARCLVKTQTESNSNPLDSAYEQMDNYWIEIYDQHAQKTLFQSDLAKRVKLSPVKPGSSAIARPIGAHEKIKPDQDGSQETLFRIRAFSVDLNGRSFVVQVARPVEKLEREIWDLVLGNGAGLILATLALFAVSRFVAGRILHPIGRMNDLAQNISEKNLDERIPHGEGRDEFSQLARTINRMLDRLQHSFVRQREFLFDTSHELKTPLTTIRLAVDEINARHGEDLPPFAAENLIRLNHQVWRMERLVKDLLSLSSLETLTRIDTGPVHITHMLTSLAEEYQFLADAHGIRIRLSLPEGLIIQGDGEKLNRAFSNILDNALKYNVDGGWVDLTGRQSEGELAITVANSGPGLAETDIPRVFDQFYRVEKSRSQAHGGSGLGLAIVKRIIELHGGKVALESEQGAWTRVTVRLPESRERGDAWVS